MCHLELTSRSSTLVMRELTLSNASWMTLTSMTSRSLLPALKKL